MATLTSRYVDAVKGTGARILDTAQGRDAATLTRAKAVKGLSVGFYPAASTWNKARTAVRHTAARLLERGEMPQRDT